MADIGKAYIQIIPEAEGISGKIRTMLGDETKKAGTDGGANLASGIKSALMKLGIGAIISKGIKDSLEAGGALQQSFGGLETLYGEEASARMKEFAMQASQYGVSANDYAEQAVSFGASLKSAFGGDTTKAMESANMAIQDMADNSAKMGTDITAIQTAYQGFAKGQYQLLDNLKLGYGGTKTEMERLLKEASKLSGQKYDISNLGDIYEAIHVIQDDLGLTGVAAYEASKTFSGSFSAMKASLTNLMASLTLGEGVDTALQSLITSASAFLFNNLIPMLWNILTSLPGALASATPAVWEQIKAQLIGLMGGQSVGEFIQSGFDIFMGWLTGFVNGLPQMMLTASEIVNNMVGAFMSSYPNVVQSGFDMLTQFIAGIASNLPNIISTGAKVILQFIATVGAHLPQILQKGVEIIGQLVAGIIRSIPNILKAIPQIFNAMKQSFMSHDWSKIGSDILAGIGNGIKNAVNGLIGAVADAGSQLVDGVKGFFKIGSPSKLMAEEVGRWIPAGIAEGITGNLGVLQSAMSEMDAMSAGSVIASGGNYRPGEMYSSTDDLSSLIASGGSQSVNVTVVLQGDAEKIFKVVRKENTKFKTSTGKSAFSY